jgi:hypothetical protein
MPQGPSRPSRRSVLRAGPAAALGLTSLALPAAASHASGFALVPQSAAPSFDEGDVILAAWSNTNTGSSATPTAPSSANVTATGVSATYRPGFASSYVETGVPRDVASQYQIGGDPTEIRWYRWLVRNTDPLLDRIVAPHLELRLTAGATPLTLTALALNAVARDPSWGGDVTLSFRTSLDGYATSLRDVILTSSALRNVLVDLAQLPVLEAGASLDVRIYFFATTVGSSSPTGIRFNAGSLQDPFDAAFDTYAAVQGTNVWSFIGSIGA